MRALVPIVAAALVTLAGATSPSFAQGANRLPESTRSERQVRDLNRSMQQRIELQQQNQALRQELNHLRTQQAPVISVPPPGSFRATCPAGSIGC